MRSVLQRGLRPMRLGSRNRTLVRATSSVNHLSELNVDFNKLPLGVGACGAVYSGRHNETCRDVAVKVMSPSLPVVGESSSEQVANSIEQERRAVEQVLQVGGSHPHVVDFMGCFEGPTQEATHSGLDTKNVPAEDSIQYFVMERLSGVSLQDRLEAAGSFDEDQAREVTRAVCEGLGFLHERGVVHRDLCPRNILYAEPDAGVGECKIIDFSHAGLLPTHAGLDDACFDRPIGSCGFIAPEVLGDKEPYSAKCDIYSLGCTVHAMMASGRLPRRHPRVGILTCLPETVSSDAHEFVDSLLSSDPAQRPSVAEALNHPWLQ